MKFKYVLTLMILWIGPVVSAQELQVLIDRSLASNPALEQSRLIYERTVEKSNQVKGLGNTQFGFGYFILNPETRSGPQEFKVSASQQFPWFGTQASKSAVLQSEAEVQNQEVIIAIKKNVLNLSKAYYKTLALKQSRDYLLDQQRILNQIHSLIQTKISNDQASLVDLLRFELRLNDLDQELLQNELNYQSSLSELHSFFDAKDALIIRVSGKFELPEGSLQFNQESLMNHPELEKYNLLQETLSYTEKLNQKEKLPALYLGLDYINVGERPDPTPDNGKDILMPMLNVSLPLFSGKNKSVSKQNLIRSKEIEAMKQSDVNRLYNAYRLSYNQTEVFLGQIKNQKRNLEQIQKIKTLLRSQLETDQIEYKEYLDLSNLELSYQLKLTKALENYYLAKSNFEYFTYF